MTSSNNTMSSHRHSNVSRISASIALLLLSSTSQSPLLVRAQETPVEAPVPAPTPVAVEAVAVTTLAPPEPTTCSCSPTVFTFTLNLDGSCDINDIETNTGIDGSFCFVEAGVSVPAPPAPEEEEEPAAAMEDPDASAPDTTVSDADASTTENEPTRKLQRNINNISPKNKLTRHRRLQEEEPTPELIAETEEPAEAEDPIVEIVSAQFLEFDTSGDLVVINQDDTYADISLTNGDRLKFNSASSFLDTSLPIEDQMSGPALVPGGASLILYGRTASGVVVRNRFFWMYDNGNCGRDNNPVEVGDEIGWVTVAETSNAWPVFCPSLPPGSPTITPRSNEPTLVPSKSPSDRPTPAPVHSMSMSMTTSAPVTTTTGKPTLNPNYHHLPAFGKSNKTPKTMKPAKSGKTTNPDHSPTYSSKSSKSTKSAKGTKGAKSYDDGHSVQGKTDKEPMRAPMDGAYNMGRVVGFDATRSSTTVNNGASTSLATKCGLGLVVSLVASFLFC